MGGERSRRQSVKDPDDWLVTGKTYNRVVLFTRGGVEWSAASYWLLRGAHFEVGPTGPTWAVRVPRNANGLVKLARTSVVRVQCNVRDRRTATWQSGAHGRILCIIMRI